MKILKENKGITLVALVITIIVLLILAGVTMTFILNGELFTYAKKASLKTEISALQEKLDIRVLNDSNNDLYGEINDILQLDDKYNDKLEIEKSKIVYKIGKWSEKDIEILEEMEVYQSAYDTYNASKDTIYYIGNENTVEHYNSLPNVGTLVQFRTLVNNGKFNYEEAHLVEDIKLNEGKYIIENGEIIFDEDAMQWTTPIGNYHHRFNKVFDGQMYTISGIYINNTNLGGAGLFNYLEGTVKNLGVINGKIIAKQEASGIAAYTSSSNAYIYRCYNAMDLYTTGTNGRIGGILASGSYCVIEECYNLGSINTNRLGCGGIVGSSNAKVINCYNRGTVTAGATSWGAGISGSWDAKVYNTYTTHNKIVCGGVVSDSYYLTTSTNPTGSTKLESFMKTQDFVDLLNTITTTTVDEETGEQTTQTETQNVWVMDTKNINDGFPILSWQQ